MPAEHLAVTAADSRAIERAARRRAREKGIRYTQALVDVRAILELLPELAEDYDDEDMDFAAAEAFYDDPANQLLCDKCGWTVGMVCPECPGCGCYNGQCSGWRHEEYMHEEELADLHACPECGGDTRSNYGCECYE